MILKDAEVLKNKLVKIRRRIHMYPEIGFKEYKTAKLVVSELKKLDIPFKKIGKTGVVGLLKGAKPGKTIALRADMDALPMQEENNKPYKSRVKGVMHACGHDAHVTCLLGAAMLLAGKRKELTGNVKLIFQPCEESRLAAVDAAELMIREGALNAPEVSSIVALHVSGDYEAGSVAVKYGEMCSNSDRIEIRIKGAGAHGAAPESGVDPIVTAAAVISALQTIVSRNVSPLDSAVVSITRINAGTTSNVIPPEVFLQGTVRTANKELREKVRKNINRIAAGTCRAMGAGCEVKFIDGYPAFSNNDKVTALVEKSAVEIIGKKNVKREKYPSMGGENFSFFADKVPAAFFWLGSANKKLGIINLGHHPKFDIDEDALPLGAAVLTGVCLNYLNKGN